MIGELYYPYTLTGSPHI